MIDPVKLVEEFDELPPMINTVLELLQATNDPEAPVDFLVKKINQDPALTAKILKLCNSPYYGLPGKIISVHKALVYVGISTLANYVLVSYLSSFYEKARNYYSLDHGELWRHSVNCAVAARCIACKNGADKDATAFTAGLMHDIGKIILYPKIGADFEQIQLLAASEQITIHEAEDQVLGCTSAQVGAALTRLWQLPEALSDAIEFHHAPEHARFDPCLVSQIHLADIIDEQLVNGMDATLMKTAFHPYALVALGLEDFEINDLIVEIEEQCGHARDLIALAE